VHNRDPALGACGGAIRVEFNASELAPVFCVISNSAAPSPAHGSIAA
jgi:hypothetical protein